MRGAVAAGHPKTAEAAVEILAAGGSAFDAALAALCAACAAEPVLSSLGGGGFLLTRDHRGQASLFDFFVQTPRRKRPAAELEFQPILADFGNARQEFHIGLGTVATPGVVRGLFDVHRALGRLPMTEIMAPAIRYAREGLAVNALQGYIFSVVAPIYRFSAEARAVYCGDAGGTALPRDGDLLRQPALANTLELLAREGDRLFYEGELGQSLVAQCQEHGGHLIREDLLHYRTIRRQPLGHAYRGYQLLTNPPPSSGGLLIAFALDLLAGSELGSMGFGSPRHLSALAWAMAQANRARGAQGPCAEPLVEQQWRRLQAAIGAHPPRARGTTHISVIDEAGNAAALSLSNGEGCGHLLADSGIMPNNMLGEEDLNPSGFHQWPTDTRVSSMMAPSMALRGNRLIVTGSGGSNRLRSAILQTLSNLIDFGMPVEQAVSAPRIHLEQDFLSLEPGLPAEGVAVLRAAYPQHHLWDQPNLFFGGCHSLLFDGQRLEGAGDPRRGGCFLRSMP